MRLRELSAARNEIAHVTRALSTSAQARFDWTRLAPAYIEMYRKVALLTSSPAQPAAASA